VVSGGSGKRTGTSSKRGDFRWGRDEIMRVCLEELKKTRVRGEKREEMLYFNRRKEGEEKSKKDVTEKQEPA